MAQRAQQFELAAEKRVVLGKQVNQLRRQKRVPGVMYGRGFDPVPLQFDARSLRQVVLQVGSSQLVSINVEGWDQPEMALVRDMQRDPIRGTLLHVDFYHVNMAERITVEIPLELVERLQWWSAMRASSCKPSPLWRWSACLATWWTRSPWTYQT